MPARIPAALAFSDAFACLGLGFCLSVLRALLPARRGRAFTFWADFLATLLALFLVQGYAARQAAAGELRWYLPAALLAGAAAAQALVVPLLCRLRAGLWAAIRPLRRLQKRAGSAFWLKVRRSAEKSVQKTRIRGRKNLKKQLPNKSRVLYNSNVS